MNGRSRTVSDRLFSTSFLDTFLCIIAAKQFSYAGEPLDERLGNGVIAQFMKYLRGIGHVSQRKEFPQQDHNFTRTSLLT